MKKFLIMLLLMSSMLYAVELPGNFNFNLYFRKPGVSDIRFTEPGITTETDLKYFSNYISPADSPAKTSFGFDWKLYENGNITILLVFASSLEKADETYGNMDTTDYMLRVVSNNTDGINYPGLNYTVTSRTGNFTTGTNSQTTELSGSQRSIKLLDGVNVNNIEGNSGHFDFDLSLDVPTGILNYQYKGVVKAYVYSN